MIEYVTLGEAKFHLRVDFSDDDQAILLYIRSASAMIKNHLKEQSVYEPERNSDDDPHRDSNWFPIVADADKEVRYEVKAATLILIGRLYRDRENAGDGWLAGYLPPEVIAILAPIRDPAVA